MLEQLLIFTRGGLILWTCNHFTNALKGSPIDTLIRSCLLEERSGAASFTYDAPGASYSLKWTFHNDLGLVFVAVYQRILHLLYVDDLLAAVKREFSRLYQPQKTAYRDFDEIFRQLQIEAEARAENFKKTNSLPAVAPQRKQQNATWQGEGKNAGSEKKSDGDGDGKKGRRLENGGFVVANNNSNANLKSSGNGSVNIGKENESANIGAFDVNRLQKLKGKGGNGNGNGNGKKKVAVVADKAEPKKVVKKNRVWDDSPPQAKLDFTDHLDGDEDGDKKVDFLAKEQGESMMDKEEVLSSDSEDEEEDDDDDTGKNSKPEAKKKGWFSSMFQSIAGKANLEKSDLEPALKALKDRLMTKNVAEEIAEKLCESVAASLEGKKLASFTRISSTVHTAMEDALVRILTPRRSIDILRDVHAAKEQRKPYVVVFVGVNGVGNFCSFSNISYPHCDRTHKLNPVRSKPPSDPPAMASNRLLTLTRRLRHPTSARPFSAASTISARPAPPPPDAMLYDRLASATSAKLRRLDHPDPRFLKHGSPVPSDTDHTRFLGAPQTRVTTLPSGLRVATESSLAARTATVGVWIDAGSRFETEESNGTAHFLEHMIFKGTAKRTVKELEEEIENMGGHLNAYTSREQTTYYAKVTNKDVPKALDILADILQNSKFDDNRIIRERDVILREMEEVEGQMEEVIFDHLHATAFQYSPLGRTILGPAQNIRTITKDHLQNYIQTHYTAPRMVVAASGAVKHEEIVEQVKTLFTKLSTDPTTASQLVAKEPANFTGSEVRILDDDIPLAQFAVAFEGAAWTDPDSIALMVMQAMLGSWNKSTGGGKHMGSELAQRVGINEVAESMMAFNTNYKDTGLFGVYAVAKKDCLDDLSYAIMHETTKLAYKVSEDDVTRARNQLKSSLLLHIDGTSPVAEDIGRQLLTYNRRIPFAELFARIDAVDASTIKRVANRFIYDKDIAIAAMGPIQRLPDYNKFRRRTYWNRY